MARENWWSNSDGLYVGYGTHTVDAAGAATVRTAGAVNELQLLIKGTEVTDSTVSTEVKVRSSAVIPAGSLILSASLQVYTAFSGSSAVLDIGAWNASSYAEIDDDGIDAAIAVATLADNYVVACDGALIGATIGAADAIIVAQYDTAAFTAGEAMLTVRYVPQKR